MLARGFQIQVTTNEALATLNRTRPSLVKLLDQDQAFARHISQVINPPYLIARLTNDEDKELSPSPEEAAERLFKRCVEKFGEVNAYTHIETPWNEEYQTSWEELALLARANIRFMELAETIGWRCLIGNIGVGNPPTVSDIEAFLPALLRASEGGHWFGVHEYYKPDGYGNPWYITRIKLMYDLLPVSARVPVIIGETGIDGGVEGLAGHGWKGYGLSEEAYRDWLRGLVNQYEGLDYVKGIAIFLCGGYSDWETFDIAGCRTIEDWLING